MYKRIHRILTEHPFAVDTVIAVTIAALLAAASVDVGERGERGFSESLVPALLVALVALPLCLRRARPYVALAGTLAFAALALGLSSPIDPAVLPIAVALYSVGSRGDRRGSMAALGASVALILVIHLAFASRASSNPEGVIRDLGWILGATALGYAVANRRAYVDQFKQRAIEAERTREEEAQRRVDEERLRIARDVHDGVAHALASISLQASAAGAVLDSDPEGAREALRQIRGSSVSALAELRATLGVLRQAGQSPRTPGPIDVTELAKVLRAGGIEVSVRQEGDERPVSAEVGDVAHRIIQEALTNVLRHSRAHHVVVTIRQEEEALLIVVADDGQGRTDGEESGNGYGITGMRERAASVGGSLEVGSRAGGGFVVRAHLPFCASAR